MTKVTAVVICSNIYLPSDDTEGPDNVKYNRGDQIEIEKSFGENILAEDKKAGRNPRLTLVIPKPKRRAKNAD